MMLRFGFEPEGPAIFISEAALSEMLAYRQIRTSDKEAGGQLFATFNGAHTFIERATPPKVLDKRSRYSFEPNRRLQRLEIAMMYRLGKHFVGDWHTHPEPVPHLSGSDRSSATDVFTRSKHQLKGFLLVVVGTAEPRDGVKMHFVSHQGIKPLALY